MLYYEFATQEQTNKLIKKQESFFVHKFSPPYDAFIHIFP